MMMMTMAQGPLESVHLLTNLEVYSRRDDDGGTKSERRGSTNGRDTTSLASIRLKTTYRMTPIVNLRPSPQEKMRRNNNLKQGQFELLKNKQQWTIGLALNVILLMHIYEQTNKTLSQINWMLRIPLLPPGHKDRTDINPLLVVISINQLNNAKTINLGLQKTMAM